MFRTTMLPALVSVFSLAVSLAACDGPAESTTGSGGTVSTGDGGAGAGAGAGGQTMVGGNGGSGGAPTTTSASGGGDTTSTTGSGGSQSPQEFCLTPCQTAADCASDDGAYSADNFACQGGGCVYVGCKSNAECTTSAGGQPRVCALDPTYSLKYCVAPCQAVADCALEDGGAYSVDNYACQGGGCVYVGCNTNAECTTSAGGQPRVCALDPAYSAKYCTTLCQTAADCATDDGTYSADNYACEGGGCVYVGCKSDAECASGGGQASVCGPWLPQ